MSKRPSNLVYTNAVPAAVYTIRLQLAKLELIGTKAMRTRLRHLLRHVHLNPEQARQVSAELAKRGRDIKHYQTQIIAANKGLGRKVK